MKLPGLLETLRDRESRLQLLRTWGPFWLCACLILFLNLGSMPIHGSEARWTQITREMFASGDFLHPTINGEPYYDKPLLTYWFIALAALFNDGIVTELIARIPSAVCALLTLGCVIVMAKQLSGEKCAIVSAWMFLTSYTLFFWGRLAEADMANLMFSTAACICFLKYRNQRSFIGYLLFFLICAAGAHAKGMGSIAVPALAVLADLILQKHWKLHLCNWKIYAAAVIGIAVYCLPFILSDLIPPAIAPEMQNVIDHDGTVKTSGFALAFRENVIRFFQPFDHKDPWWSYFVHLPRHLVPWTPFFLLALINLWKKRKSLTENQHYLLLSAGLIFLFFTLSGSRRHYYIMPILPFCFILTADFLARKIRENNWLSRIESFLIRLFMILLPVLAAVSLVVCILPVYLHLEIFTRYSGLRFLCIKSLPIAFCFLLLEIVLLCNRPRFELLEMRTGIPRRLLMMLALMIPAIGFAGNYMLTLTSHFRTERPFLRNVKTVLDYYKCKQGDFYFYEKDSNNAVWYLNQPYRIPMLRDERELRAFMAKNPGKKILLLSQIRSFQKLPAELLEKMPIKLEESAQMFDKKKSSKCMQLRSFRISEQ